MTSLLETARRLRLVNLTPARLGREAWRATVQDEHRRTQATSETRRRERSEPVITLDRLRAIQERERAIEAERNAMAASRHADPRADKPNGGTR